MVASPGRDPHPRAGRGDRSPGKETALPRLQPRQRADRFAALLRLAEELERFAPGEEPDRLLRYVHRELGGLLEADLGYVWALGRGAVTESVYYQCWTKRGEQLLETKDRARVTELAVRFARDRRAPEDRNLLMTLVESRQRPVGVFAFVRAGRRYGREDARLANDAAQILGRQLEHRERERIYLLRERIVRKVLLQLRPADILYQVLHGLKRLLGYDHSASVHTIDPDGSAITPRAEVIAWTKGKSARIGRRMPLTQEMLGVIAKLDPCILIDTGNCDPRIPSALLEEVSVVAP
ncbi:MAG: hypothetical protein GF346_00265, partial [Candidatus Eisenbacteria bacterium]|nr:hypothetical protein [Candidatus Latescibacterota bacterium]MBD3300866.1 hypothetical protein [Candidatus Eisenbacteria bacterium]